MFKNDDQFFYNYPKSEAYRRFVQRYSRGLSATKKGKGLNLPSDIEIPEHALMNINLGYSTKFLKFTFLEYLEGLICLIILPVRLLLYVSLTALLIIVTKLATVGLPGNNKSKDNYSYLNNTKPVIANSLWRKCFVYLGFFIFRFAALITFGVYWIKIKGKPAKTEEAPIRLFLPHYSYYDIMSQFPFLPTPELSTFVHKSSVNKILDLQVIEGIAVDRSSGVGQKEVRHHITEEIKYRSKNHQMGWYPISISPEGTAQGGTGLMPFKLGAFMSGLPVQAVVIRSGRNNSILEKFSSTKDDFNYPIGAKGQEFANSLADFDLSGNPVGALNGLFRCMFNLYCHCEIEYLPPYIPNNIEKTDSKIYANNCRKFMSEKTKIPFLDVCYEDSKFQFHLLETYQMNPLFGMVKFHKLRCLYGAKYNGVKFYFDKIMVHCQNHELFHSEKLPLVAKNRFVDSIILNDDKSNFTEVYKTLGPLEDWPEKLEICHMIEIMILFDKARGNEIVQNENVCSDSEILSIGSPTSQDTVSDHIEKQLLNA